MPSKSASADAALFQRHAMRRRMEFAARTERCAGVIADHIVRELPQLGPGCRDRLRPHSAITPAHLAVRAANSIFLLIGAFGTSGFAEVENRPIMGADRMDHLTENSESPKILLRPA